jgi:hypothetical protein
MLQIQNNMNEKIHNQTTFCQAIEKMVYERKISYLEAVCEYITDNNIEATSASKLINNNIKQKIEYEASSLNMINRGKTPAKLF